MCDYESTCQSSGNYRQCRIDWLWHMAFFRATSLEVVLLYGSQGNRVDRCRSGDQCILFIIPGVVWNPEHAVRSFRQSKSLFNRCHAGGDLYFMVDPIGISACLPARFNPSPSPIRDVVGICRNKPMLYDFTLRYGVANITWQPLLIL